ncbi:MAG: hypothetical protein AB7I48_00685 [Planctomycetaceae bacterium]
MAESNGPGNRSRAVPNLSRSQISFVIPRHEYLALRAEAARQGKSIAGLVRDLMEPEYSRITAARPG